MKSEKRNKKYWSWTPKQKGKKRKCTFNGNAPKSYCKPYWASHKTKEKEEIARFLKGVDESELNFPYHHKNSATWDYW